MGTVELWPASNLTDGQVFGFVKMLHDMEVVLSEAISVVRYGHHTPIRKLPYYVIASQKSMMGFLMEKGVSASSRVLGQNRTGLW